VRTIILSLREIHVRVIFVAILSLALGMRVYGATVPPGCNILPERIQASAENRFVPSGKGLSTPGIEGAPSEPWTPRALSIDMKAGTIVWSATTPDKYLIDVTATIQKCKRTDDPLPDEPAQWSGNVVSVAVSSWRSRIRSEKNAQARNVSRPSSVTDCESKDSTTDFLTIFRDANGTPVSFAIMAAEATGCPAFGALSLEPYPYANGGGVQEVRMKKLGMKSRSKLTSKDESKEAGEGGPSPREPTTKTGKNAFSDPLGPPLAWTEYGVTIPLKEDPAGRSLTEFSDGGYSKCMTYVGVCSTTVQVCCMDLDGKGPIQPQCSQREDSPSTAGEWQSWQASCYRGRQANKLGKALHLQ
jgi:hypothetical protein